MCYMTAECSFLFYQTCLAGQEAFMAAFAQHNKTANVMIFEKDLLTGKLVFHIYPDQKVCTERFQKIEKLFTNYFDMVADLLLAIRLSNYLVVESANTEIGSDLIILQKKCNQNRTDPERIASGFQSSYGECAK